MIFDYFMKTINAFYHNLRRFKLFIFLCSSLSVCAQECPDIENFFKGEILLESKQYPEADLYFAEQAQNNEEALFFLSKALYHLENFSAAIEKNERVMKLFPKCGEVTYWQGELLETFGDYASAIGLYNKASKQGYSSEMCLQGRARCKIGIGDYTSANVDIAKLIKENPSTENQLIKAEMYLSQKKEKSALNLLNQIIAKDQRSGKAYFLLSICYMEEKQPEKSLDAYKKASSLDSEFADPHVNKGIELFMEGNQKEACKEWKKAGKLAKPIGEDLINTHCK